MRFALCRIAIAKHRAGATALAGLAAQVGMRPRLEVSATLRAQDRGRPADILLPAYSHGRDLAIDFTVATAMLNVADTIASPLHAMQAAIDRKRAKYQGRVAANSEFFAFAVDTSGAFHPSTEKIICRLAGRLAHVKCIPRWQASQRIYQKISFAVAAETGRGLSRLC